MYNRYIPQPDGTYRRNRIQDSVPAPEIKLQTPPPPPPPAPPHREPEPARCNNCIHNQPPRRPVPRPEYRKKENTNVTGFLKQLLPKDFDVEDLMVVLLLLLMSADTQDNQNTALLTLVLYLFL